MMRATVKFDIRKIEKRVKQANIRSLNHAAAYIRQVARHSIKRSQKAASPGQPPHTRRGLYRRAILFSVEKAKQSAVIGPDYSIAGQSAMVHEHGGIRYGRRYPKRPFMGPALRAAAPKLPKSWANSVR